MKLQRIAIFISLLFLILSCESPEPEDPKATEYVPSPSQVTAILPSPMGVSTPLSTSSEIAPSVSVSPNSTVVEFLVDKSGSVDENCGEVGKKRFEFVNYMLDILRRNAYSSSDPSGAKLYVGMAQFGTDFNSNQGPISIEDLDKNYIFLPDKEGTNDTEYATGIQKAISSMMKIDAKEKNLIIFTDGEFESDSISEIYETVTPHLGEGLNIYIALLFIV